MTIKKHTKDDSHKNIYVLLGINILISAIVLFTVFTKNARSLEEFKAGWDDNFDLVKQIYELDQYKSQQKLLIEQTMNQAKAMPTAQDTDDVAQANIKTDTEENAAPAQDDKDMIQKFAAIIKDAHIQWDKNARITILEYSELLCPYCQRQHTSQTLQKVLDKFPKEVNTAFRHYIVHEPARKFAEIAECAAEQDGTDGFLKFIDEAFNIGRISDTNLDDVISKSNLNKSKIDKCLKKWEIAQTVKDQSTEWRSLFGVKGTPGNVIIDHETGRFVLIPGAYPVEKFVEEIEKLLK